HDRDARRRARPRLGVLAVLAVSARTGASRLNRRERMREVSRSRALPVVLLGTLIVSGCVLSPPAGTLVPPRVEVLAADPRAVRCGAAPAPGFEHPEIRETVRALFGGGGRADGWRWVSAPVPAFFSKSSPPQ